MSYSTELTEDCLGIEHVGSGLVTGADLLAASVTARRLVENTENFNYELVDFSEVTALRVSPEELERIVAQDKIAAESRPRAMVVIIAPSAQTFQLATAWEEQVRELGWTIHIARERDEGMQWLEDHREQARTDLLTEKDETASCE
ncbi:MAG: hypothetical protein ACR2HH_02250 [Chthoniobacterales bacterium]